MPEYAGVIACSSCSAQVPVAWITWHQSSLRHKRRGDDAVGTRRSVRSRRGGGTQVLRRAMQRARASWLMTALDGCGGIVTDGEHVWRGGEMWAGGGAHRPA